jgi:predicted aldo/keto reductase-like oxidoreductase
MLQKIINVYNKITNADKSKKNNLEFNDKIGYHYSEFENGELFNQVLDKCITEHTDITGLEGIEKTNFITILTNKLYAEKKILFDVF